MKKRKNKHGKKFSYNKMFDKYDLAHNYSDSYKYKGRHGEVVPHESNQEKHKKEIFKKNEKIIKDNNMGSFSELKVYQFLKDNHIKFTNQEKGELNCINPKTGERLPYNFEVPLIKTVIEVQGKQHYEKTDNFNKTDEDMEYQKYRDSIKRSFAKKNGYTEIEIPYQDVMGSTEYMRILNHLVDAYQDKLGEVNGFN